MSRIFVLSLIFLALAPVAKAESLPFIMTDAMNDAAATGNPLVVEAVSDRLSTLFPSYRSDIANYVERIAEPATLVANVVQDVPANQPVVAGDVFALETAAGPNDGHDMANELNNLIVGSPVTP